MKCAFCKHGSFFEGRVKCQVCARCELIHHPSTNKPLGWAIRIGRFSGGIVPYELVIPHVDQNSPIDVASVICLAAQIGLSEPTRVRFIKEFEDHLNGGTPTIH